MRTDRISIIVVPFRLFHEVEHHLVSIRKTIRGTIHPALHFIPYHRIAENPVVVIDKLQCNPPRNAE